MREFFLHFLQAVQHFHTAGGQNKDMILELLDQLVPLPLPLVQVHQPLAVPRHKPPFAMVGGLALLQQANYTVK